jgi:LmbE family N-acetylglucosaminyl deacetylase
MSEPMRQVSFKELKRILCLGAHSDDIEIGCGGTILKLIEDNPNIEILWVVFSAEGVRTREANQSARAFLKRAGKSHIVVKDFRGSFFPFQGEQIKEFFETLKSFQPDVVFTHYREDRHQDHRVLSDLSWNTFRNHVILEYEIPKYDGDFGVPNFFVPVTKAHCARKSRLLLKHFQSQSGKHWFTTELFLATGRIRGMECNSPTEYAEAFYSRKMLLL